MLIFAVEMNPPRLERDLIHQPELWKLAMMVSDRRLDIALWPPVASEAPVYHYVMLDPDAPTPLRALENAVYDNPLLLCEFREITCMADNLTGQTVIPAESRNDAALLFHSLYPDGGDELLTETVEPLGVTVVSGLQEDFAGFMRRTFFGIRIGSPIVPLLEYVSGIPAPYDGGRTLYASIRDDCRMDLISTDRSSGLRLLSANTFPCPAAEDCAYYIARALEAPSGEGEAGGHPASLFLAGDPRIADSVTGMLTPYIENIGPLQLPDIPYAPVSQTSIPPNIQLLLSSCE